MCGGDHSGHRPITTDLSGLRDWVQRCGAEAGIKGVRLDDLVIGVNEAAINVLEHGGGKGTVSIWDDDVFLTVDVVDSAGLLTSDRARTQRPPEGANRGFGLWLMGLLCDEFTVSQESGRSRVRLRMRL
ncbi:ATP-binding protein [Nonomuraea sp. NPDC000554]|uniref:ATP-binding protein n=1 Tax=Nonomuraea sp. NPDC000554 TaxID=3154259 RepID=UPI00333267FC